MSGGLVAGGVNPGAILPVLTLSGTASNATATIGTVPAGHTWFILSSQLWAVHDNLGTTNTALIQANGNTINQAPSSVNQTVADTITYPVGTGYFLSAGQTVTLISPSADITAYGLVSYVQY
jgi:hypothetical protein